MTSKLISKDAILIDDSGVISEYGLEVWINGDTVSIGGTTHNVADLIITETRITSRIAGWEVIL